MPDSASRSTPISRDGPVAPGASPLRVALAIGLPGSGKSSWFREQGITPLSSDELRLLLADDINEQRYQKHIFETLCYLLGVRLDLGRPVTYIDATNLVREQRKPCLEIAKLRGCNLEALFFDVSLEICMRRNSGRTRRVPEDVMERMAAALEPPTHEEGFDLIIEIGAEGEEIRRSEHKKEGSPR